MWTLPSHASLFTGHWPHELGVNWTTPLRPDVTTLAEYLGTRGYDTAGFVANLEYCGRETGLNRGFVHYEDYPIGLYETFTRYVGLGHPMEFPSWACIAERLVEKVSGRPMELNPRSSEHAKRGAEVDRAFLDWLSWQRDLPATIADILGPSKEAPFPGRSLARLWSGDPSGAGPSAEPLLTETDKPLVFMNLGREPAAKGPMKAMVAGGMHYIRSGDGSEELYYLKTDPEERLNVAGAPAAGEILRRLRGGLAAMLRKRQGRGRPQDPPPDDAVDCPFKFLCKHFLYLSFPNIGSSPQSLHELRGSPAAGAWPAFRTAYPAPDQPELPAIDSRAGGLAVSGRGGAERAVQGTSYRSQTDIIFEMFYDS